VNGQTDITTGRAAGKVMHSASRITCRAIEQS
jgi:hypothetical protein